MVVILGAQAGTLAAEITRLPGASGLLMEAQINYGIPSTMDVTQLQSSFCSQDAAARLAQSAGSRAQFLWSRSGQSLEDLAAGSPIGLGITAALRSNRPKRG